VSSPPLTASLESIHKMKHVQSKTYIHFPQRCGKVLAIVRVDEEEDGGGRKSGGAGTVNILAANKGMVT